MADIQTDQTCTRCGAMLPLTEEYWHRDFNNKGGWSLQCKNCKHELQKSYRTRPVWLGQNFEIREDEFDRSCEIDRVRRTSNDRIISIYKAV